MKTRALLVSGLTLALISCQETPEQAPIRSLRASGETTFVCIGPDGQGRPLSECAQGPTLADGGLTVAEPGNELFALVTQTATAEVAVVRLTGVTGGGNSSSGVVDVDRSNPGVTPLRVGAGPVDIVTTPGGMASFVGVSSPGREGIFALPTVCVGQPQPGEAGRDLTTWPACRLPSAPGDMVVLVDPADRDGLVRASCDGAYEPVTQAEESTAECRADLGKEGAAAGRRKLAVALPELGEIAILDAQALLDREAGSFENCAIEARLPLERTPPATVSQALPPDLAVNTKGEPQTSEYAFSSSFAARPGGMASDGERLFVADRGSPLIHVLDVGDPCNIAEEEPLVATSYVARERVVTTSKVAVSPVTTQGEKFLYAIDEQGDGSVTEGNAASVMIFDLTPGSTQRTPLVRPRSSEMPFEAPDRIEFAAAAKDVAFALHDLPIADPVTGTAVIGTRCDPNPSVSDDSPAARYRNSSNFESGAGPNTLRGVFGFVLLSNGRVAIVDVDDFDAECRRPRTLNPAASSDFRGCASDPTSPALYTASGTPDTPATVTDEVSCRVVERHRARSGDLVLTSSSGQGIGAPSLRSFPRLSLFGRSLSPTRQTLDGRNNPLLLGVDFAGVTPASAVPAQAFVGTTLRVRGDGPDDLVIDPRIAQLPSMVLPWKEPRAYPRAERVTVTFEGALASELSSGFYDAAAGELEDQSARFCDLGVQDAALTRDMGKTKFGLDEADLDRFEERHTDYVQITNSLLPEDDSYWNGRGASCGGSGYRACVAAFEIVSEEDLGPARDLKVLAAYQDHLEVEPRTGGAELAELLACCFPEALTYRVRAGNQWVMRGSVSGFRHTVAADANDGFRCVRDYSPYKVREQWRAFEISSTSSCDDQATDLARACAVGKRTPDDVVCFRDDLARGPVEPNGQGSECIFDGLTARFAVYRGLEPSQRDMVYAVDVQGGFAPQAMSLLSGTRIVLPVALEPIPGFNQLAVVDSQDRGLMILGLRSISGSAPGLRQSFF